MSTQWKRILPAATAIIATLLFIHPPSLLAQPTEEEVAGKITQVGGTFRKDEEGRIMSVSLSSKRYLPLLDEHIESIDFSVLARLQFVSISFSHKVTDRSLVHLQKAPPGLLGLSIQGAQITDEETVRLLAKHKSSLRLLDLSETPITDRTLSEIGQLENLHMLFVCRTKITDKGLKSLAKLQKLDSLNLSATNISDAGLGEVTKLTNLTALVLMQTKVTDAGIQQLAALQNLEFLWVSSTKVTENGKNALQALLPNLEFRKEE